ncbi:MAG: ZIP family metal transporter [Armatimonadota bacterium]|nr:ZIP family metal transporter [Armatimonadota bacterium]
MMFLLLRSTLATLIAFGSGALGVALGQIAPRRLTLLVYAAMGTLLAVTLFDILPDAKELLSWPAFLIAGLSGYGLFWALGKYVYHICPACAVGAFDQAATERLGQTVVLLMIALSIHSAMDGLAVVVGDEIVGHPNLALLIAVAFHKFPEGLALAVLLLGAGYSRRTALLWTLGIESMTEFGALLGIFGLRHASLPHLGLLFANVGGGFVYLIVTTLGLWTRPRQAQTVKPSNSPFFLSGGLAFALMGCLIWTLRRWMP